jgi:hypothetical protein
MPAKTTSATLKVLEKGETERLIILKNNAPKDISICCGWVREDQGPVKVLR